MMQKHFHGLLVLYIAVFLLSLNGLFAKLIPLDALSITQLRSVIAVFGFLAFGLVRKRKLRVKNLKQQFGVAFLGLLLGLHWITFFHAMQVSTVAIGMLSLFSFPIMTILLEPLFNKKRLYMSDVLAGFAVLSGIAIMVSQDLCDIGGSVAQGVFWGVLSALLFSLRNLIQKYHFSSISSDSLMFHQVLTIVLMLAPFIDIPKISGLNPSNLGSLLLLGIFSTATAHTLLSYSLKQLAAKSVALISCLQSLLAAILAWFVLSEMPQMSVVIGGAMILSVAMYESVKKKS